MNGAAARRYSCTSVMPSTGSSQPGPARAASSSSWLDHSRTPRPLPPWLCLVMNGAGIRRAAAASPSRPATAIVAGTSNPAAASAVSWSTLLTSSSSTRRPLTTTRPCASSQHSTPRASSLAYGWPRVCDDALTRDQNTPSGGGPVRSSTPSPSSHCSCGTPAASKAAPSGAYQSGFSCRTCTFIRGNLRNPPRLAPAPG